MKTCVQQRRIEGRFPQINSLWKKAIAYQYDQVWEDPGCITIYNPLRKEFTSPGFKILQPQDVRIFFASFPSSVSDTPRQFAPTSRLPSLARKTPRTTPVLQAMHCTSYCLQTVYSRFFLFEQLFVCFFSQFLGFSFVFKLSPFKTSSRQHQHENCVQQQTSKRQYKLHVVYMRY